MPMTTSKHAIEQDELMAYLDGELSTDRAAAAVAHLEHCSECQTLAADFRGLSRQLMAWEVEAADSGIPPRISAVLEEREQKPESSRVSPSALRHKVMMRRWSWAGAFAILCIVVGLGIKLMPFEKKSYSSELAPSGYHQWLASPADQSVTRRERVATKLVAPATPGAASDSNGLFHGMGDHAANSFSIDGQPVTDKQSKVFENFQPTAKGQNPPGAGPMIIRTAGITLTTDDFGNARAALDEILKRHRGYVGELNVSTPTGAGRSFTATLRVPADQLDATMADLRKLGRVEAESQSGQEVTAQYVDLEARLANARHTEERLTDLLQQRTGKLSDVLAFEKEIDRVRGEIERMEAERKNLANQVDFASVSTTVTENFKAQLQLAPVSTSSQIHNAAVEGYRTMVEGVVGVILFLFSYGPSILLWGGILFFPARAAWRKARRTFAH
jgi:hypothetical protein